MKNLIITLSIIVCGFVAQAQPLILEKSESRMVIQGTSSLHDWESIVEVFDVQSNMNVNQIVDIQFTATVKSIKSGKSGMDNNTYKALKENEYPEIKFSSSALRIQEGQLIGKGQLNIAGKSRELPVNLTIKQDAKTIVNGAIKIKMTDYDIAPPTAVFGTIKTGDDITIQFDFTLIKS